MRGNILKNLKLILVAKPMELGIVICQVMSKMLKVIIRIGRKNDTPYIGVNFIAISSSKYHIYAANLF